MAKKSNNRILMTLQLFGDGIVWYCKYLDTFIKYMFFPVFGQIIGVFLIFAANYYFIVNIPKLVKQYPLLDNIPLVFTLLIICVAPGFLIFGKAFFDYLIAFTSINSMAYVSRGEKMKNKPLETKTYDDLLKKRLGKYIILLLLFSLLFIVGICPLLTVPYLILCVYLSLTFQVFMLEDSVSPIGAFKRSFYLVKTNFGITILLISLSFILTYWLIPNIFVFAFEKSKLIPYLSIPAQSYLDILPVKELFSTLIDSIINSAASLPQEVNSQLTALQNTDLSLNSFINTSDLAQQIVKSIISASVIAFLLPLRCAWFTLLYKIFDTEKTEELRKNDSKKGK